VVTGKDRESSGDLSRPAPTPQSGQDKVSQLKSQITARTYRVDSRAVAREMLFKVRMMALLKNQQRHQPVSGASAPSPE
jgi:hypothetical protein